jgi:hypothetical protein
LNEYIFGLTLPNGLFRCVMRSSLCLLSLATLGGCDRARSGAEPNSFGRFEGFETITPGEPLKEGSTYLCLSYGLNEKPFELCIDDKLVLAGTASDDVEQFAQLQGPTVVKELPDLPEQFEVRVTFDGEPAFEQIFKGADGPFLILEYNRQQQQVRVHQVEGLVYE